LLKLLNSWPTLNCKVKLELFHFLGRVAAAVAGRRVGVLIFELLEHSNHFVENVIMAGVHDFNDLVKINPIVLSVFFVPFMTEAHDT